MPVKFKNNFIFFVFQQDNKRQYNIAGHSVPIAALGAFILFLGFLAFNGGSELQIVGGAGHGAAVAVSFMNTIIGGAAGSILAVGLNYLHAIIRGKSVLGMLKQN